MKKRYLFYMLILTNIVLSRPESKSQDYEVNQPTADLENLELVEHLNAIPYLPFTYDASINPVTKIPYRPEESIQIEIDGIKKNLGTAKEYLDFLNLQEKRYSAVGKSLRDADVFSLHKLKDNTERIIEDHAKNMKIPYEILKDKIRPRIEKCTLIELKDLQVNEKTRALFKQFDQIVINNGVIVTANEFVRKINQQQKILCSLGLDMLRDIQMTRGSTKIIDEILANRLSLIKELGISGYSDDFNFTTINLPTKNLDEIKNDIEKSVKALELPSPEMIYKLSKESSLKIPEELQIPDLPEIRSPIQQKRMDLDLKKRKEWKGFDWGNRKTFNTYANAWLEIRSSEREMECSAEGKGGAYLFNKEYNILYGFGQFYAGTRGVRGNSQVRVLGYDVFNKNFEETSSLQWNAPDLYNQAIDFSYEAKFMIGPVPVYVTTGVRGRVYLGLTGGLGPTLIEVTSIPGLEVSAFGNAAVGVGRIISAGVEGSLVLLNDRMSIEGKAKLQFSKDAIPYILIGMNAENQVHTLDGKMSIFAEYPYVKFRRGIPKIINKREYVDMWNWEGIELVNKIMNYELEMSPFNVKMRGDLIDSNDRVEFAKLKGVTNLEAKKKEVYVLERNVTEKERSLYKEISLDLNTKAAQTVVVDTDIASKTQDELDRLRIKFLNDAYNSLGRL
ncbi:MAG: hypothetical protein HQK50_10435 [Oligoflexia bacterium]|nr:hypothetical protein [Oligoflexia bacterium]